MKIKRVDWHDGAGFRVLGGVRRLPVGVFDLFGIRISPILKIVNEWNSAPPFNRFSVSFELIIGRAYSGYLAQYGMLFMPGRRVIW